MTTPIMGDLQPFPMRTVLDPDVALYTVRATVGSGSITYDKTGVSITDETGTGVYTLNFPPCRAVKGIRGTVVKQGGSTALTMFIVGNDTLPNASAGTWKFNSYAVTVSSGAIALADLVNGDVIDFVIYAQRVL